MKLKITERGYAGHFIGSNSCSFRRNTLIEYGNKKVIVSTVGNYQPDIIKELPERIQHEIGINRTYETMAFLAKKEGPYWEANVSQEFPFKSNWALSELEYETDAKADEMHEKVVKEISNNLIK